MTGRHSPVCWWWRVVSNCPGWEDVVPLLSLSQSRPLITEQNSSPHWQAGSLLSVLVACCRWWLYTSLSIFLICLTVLRSESSSPVVCNPTHLPVKVTVGEPLARPGSSELAEKCKHCNTFSPWRALSTWPDWAPHLQDNNNLIRSLHQQQDLHK